MFVQLNKVLKMPLITVTMFNDVDFMISIVIIAFELIVFLPLMFYGTFAFSKCRNNILIGKRYPSLTFVAVIGLVIHSISWTFATLSENKILLPWTMYAKSFRLVGVSVYVWPICLRFWMLYYNINWIYQTQNQQWKSIIDSSFKHPTKYYSQTKQWFIVNHKKYGNYPFLKKYLPIVIIVDAIVLVSSFIIA